MNQPQTAANPPLTGTPDPSLREYLETNADIVTRVVKPVSIDDIGALSAQSEGPILFENIREHPGFRLCDMLVKHRWSQCRALAVGAQDYLPTLARRLRMPPRGLVEVATGPVKEVVLTGAGLDWTRLPVPRHSDLESDPYFTAMNILRDPETGHYNSCHAGTSILGPRHGLVSFVTPHSHEIMRKYRESGQFDMPIAFVAGVPPAYEIVANFSGLHMDLWGEMDMVGTVMNRDIEMVRCETIDLTVPAQAEFVVEGIVNLRELHDYEGSIGPTTYNLPKSQRLLGLEVTAITMRRDRPIYRNHLTNPQTDHQTLPRLCHEAVLYNRLSEIGVRVRDVRFPTWGAALSCILQIEAPREGFVNDALLQTMGAPWLNTKMVVAVSPDTDIDDPGEVYMAIAARCDPQHDVIIVGNTRGNPYDPSARPVPGDAPWRVVGKIGIDATIKDRYDRADFERATPKNWGRVRLEDYL